MATIRRSAWRLAAASLIIAATILSPGDGRVELVEARGALPHVNPHRDAYFSATGQTARGPFLAYWIANQHIGAPVGPPVHVDGEWVQWFEFAKLALTGTTMDSGSPVGVNRAHIGRLFADSVGYSTGMDAFVPKQHGPGLYFAETGHAVNQGFLTVYQRWGMAQQLGYPISDEFSIGRAVYQFFEFGALSWSSDTDVQRVPVGALDAGMQGRLGAPHAQHPDAVNLDSASMHELTDLLVGERWIDIDLSRRVMTAYIGNYEVMSTVVDIGHPNSPTVRGTFTIYLKNRVQTLRGTHWDGTPYTSPDVPYVMYFWHDYAIHPSATRAPYGGATSPGCVIPPLAIAEFLWDFASYGTVVVVR
ncbi:MAG TPA: L,D-transpeptidase family protein [Thermomicrobiales bacterium]|nr:L,D-transpeptidase family protein [Thermomicrobiales bacterium]